MVMSNWYKWTNPSAVGLAIFIEFTTRHIHYEHEGPQENHSVNSLFLRKQYEKRIQASTKRHKFEINSHLYCIIVFQIFA